MAPPSIEVTVEPSVLIWARESIGKDVKDAARKLGKSTEFVEELEAGKKKPRLTQLEKLAQLYKRPLAALLLSTPPPPLPIPEDFRTLPPEEREPFSSETRLAIRRAIRIQRLATELTKELKEDISPRIAHTTLPEGFEDLTIKAEELAQKTRSEFGIEIEEQLHKWRSNSRAFKEWKLLIEDKNVLVFQIKMPLKETRGFSLPEDTLPAMVLNHSDSDNGKIFSLFHEYAHLMLNHGGICDMRHENRERIEVFCNYFAGAFLVPKDALLNHELVRANSKKTEWTDEVLEKLSWREFKVSREVILRRLLILEHTTEKFYKNKREEWRLQREEKEKEGKREKKGRRYKPTECIREKGVPFISLVLEAHSRDYITYSDVADYLGVRLQYLSKIEELVRKSW